MKTLFKITALMLITSIYGFAQTSPDFEMDEKHIIYKENFTTNANTILVLNLKNTAAQVLESPDNKVYIEYTKEFNNTRKKRVQQQLKHLIVSGKKEGDKITYSAKTRNDIRFSVFEFDELMLERAEKKELLKGFKVQPIARKSLDSVLQDIKLSDFIYREKVLGAFKIKSRSPRYKKNMQFTITKMIIKIPKNVHVRATLENANIVFIDDFSNRATMNVRNSKLKFKSVGHPLNIFDVDNGYFRTKEVTSGTYSFANVKHVTIGQLSNTLINSEFTKVEIGEIGKNNKIVDFNSKYFIHNFHKDFGRLSLETDYTELNIFSPENIEYYLETYGYNTVHYKNGITTKIKSSGKSEPSKMMVIGKESYPNKIKINTTHGIIRFGEKTIDFGEDN